MPDPWAVRRERFAAVRISARPAGFLPDRLDFCSMVCKSYDILLPARWQIIPMDNDAARALACLPVEELQRRHEEAGKTAARLLPMTPYARTNRAADALANRIARPLLQQYGYRTLKAFTAAIAENDGKPLVPQGPSPD